MRAAAETVCAQLRDAGFCALFAGGCVRDMLLGVEPKDFDIATDARPDQVSALFDRTYDVGAEFGVSVVITDCGQFEVATFRSDGAYLDGRRPSSVTFVGEQEDALRRDFTVNAMFYDPAEDKILDYVGGRTDLESGLLRTVGDPAVRFAEDHLRLLRGVRFAARLGFDIEPATLDCMSSMAAYVTDTSPERIRDELTKMLTEGAARRAYELLNTTGMLAHVLPEVDAMQACAQPPQFHPEGDVYEHTMLMLQELKDPSDALAWAVLLHDVGKPVTQTFEDRIRFNFHDKAGARIAKDICQRLRMSKHVAARVNWLVGQHMRLAWAPRMRESKLKRFVREEGFEELIELCRLDCISSHADVSVIEWVKEYLINLAPEEVRPVLFITGNDLIELGFKPGPKFRKILAAIEDAQLEGIVKNKEEALALVRSQWRK